MAYATPPAHYLCDVLIVEDFGSLADLLAETLQESGLSVCVALDGRSALELAMHCTPRVALIDCMLPDIEGIRLVEPLRAKWPDTEFVLMSGNIGGVSADLAQRLGIRLFLNKPVPMGGLCRAMHNLVSTPRSKKPAGGDRHSWISLGIGSPAADGSDPRGNAVTMPLAPLR